MRPVHPTRQIVEHLSLGDSTQAGAVPRCSDVLRLGQEAKSGSLLYAVAPVAVPVTTPPLSGTLAVDTTVPTGGTYTAWLAGDWYGNATVWVDGHKVGSFRYLTHSPSGDLPQCLIVMSVDEGKSAEMIIAGKGDNGPFWRFVTGNDMTIERQSTEDNCDDFHKGAREELNVSDQETASGGCR